MRVAAKVVDRHDERRAHLLDIAGVPVKVGEPAFYGGHVLPVELLAADSSMHFESANGRDQCHCIGWETRRRRDNVAIFFETKIRVETCLRDDDIAQFPRETRCKNAAAAVRDIAEWAPMNESGRAFQRLD